MFNFEAKKTIVIDIEKTLFTKLDLKSVQEYEGLKQLDKFDIDYIVIDKNSVESCSECSSKCICKLEVYLVRPYAYDFLNTI